MSKLMSTKVTSGISPLSPQESFTIKGGMATLDEEKKKKAI
jgi:hypothetical protein